MTELVYFQATLDDHVYVGWSGRHGRRQRDHEREGKIFLAALPGSGNATGSNEDNILRHFTNLGKLVRGKSTFEGDEVKDYVAWLVSRGYASTDPVQAEEMPKIPYEVWKPEKATDPFLDETGQGMLIGFCHSARERVQQASGLVWLMSRSDQWFTPPQVIDRARQALGGKIDTDPASCAEANKWIDADIWYDINTDGLALSHPWSGTVWLNPPYGTGDHSASKFVQRLISELDQATVIAAITCLNLNSASANWFASVWDKAAVHLIWRGRIDFIQPGSRQDSSPSKGTILSYFGPRPHQFALAFAGCGRLITVAR